jgi:hypothetical protein
VGTGAVTHTRDGPECRTHDPNITAQQPNALATHRGRPAVSSAAVAEDRSLPAWQIVGGIVGALALIFLLGVGYGQEWGAPQWGPLASWVAGALTFGAVVVALREAGRSQRAREVDYEISRRRECIEALADMWGAAVGQMIPFRDFVNYLDDLPAPFNPDAQRNPNPLRETKTFGGDEIVGRIHAFFDEWANRIEPQLFTAGLILRGTPLYEPVVQVNKDANTIKSDGIRSITRPVLEGQRPNTEPLMKMWQRLLARRDEHSQLAHKHFSLDRRDVEQYLRQSRRR